MVVLLLITWNESPDSLKTFNIPSKHNASTCIDPQSPRASHNIATQATLVAVDIHRSLLVFVGGSLFSKYRKIGLF